MVCLYREISPGHYDREAPKEPYKDSLKKAHDVCHSEHHSLWRSPPPADRRAWHRTVHQAVTFFEDSRTENLKEKRHRRKSREVSAALPDVTFNRSRCCCTCLSASGSTATGIRRGQPPCSQNLRSFAKTSHEMDLFTIVFN